MPPTFFVCEQSWYTPGTAISFRKRSICPATVRDKSKFYAEIAHNKIAPIISQFVKYPSVDIPSYPMQSPADIPSARSAGAAVARSLRSSWGIGWGPISNVIQLLESRGVRLFYVREAAEHLDGFACWTQETPYIFINGLTDDPARVRLDVAHELGHLVMHREIALDAKTDLIEAMAWGFAVEFMAPWTSIEKESLPMPNLNRLGQMRGRWRISMQALVKHMHANGAISDSAYSNAFRRFSVLGYRRGPEPVWVLPDSSAIHEAFVQNANLKSVSLGSISEREGIPERLLGDMVPSCTMPFEM